IGWASEERKTKKPRFVTFGTSEEELRFVSTNLGIWFLQRWTLVGFLDVLILLALGLGYADMISVLWTAESGIFNEYRQEKSALLLNNFWRILQID
ncbi:hypothetical protein RhiirA4_490719, partial [Rhizophagus irregularis]